MGLKRSTSLNRAYFPRQVACCPWEAAEAKERSPGLGFEAVPFTVGAYLWFFSLVRGGRS